MRVCVFVMCGEDQRGVLPAAAIDVFAAAMLPAHLSHTPERLHIPYKSHRSTPTHTDLLCIILSTDYGTRLLVTIHSRLTTPSSSAPVVDTQVRNNTGMQAEEREAASGVHECAN